MRIGIDARFAVHNRRGIGNYTLKLVQNLALIDKENQYILYIDKEDLEGILPKQENFRIVKLGPSNYFIWEQICLPSRAKTDCLDILHCTGNTAPLYLSEKVKLVSTIHDVMYLKDYSVLPQSLSMYQRLGRIYRKAIVPKAVDHAAKIITVSYFSKKDILCHLPTLKEDGVAVTYEAADERFTESHQGNKVNLVAEKLGIKGDYIFTLGALDPRKNTQMVIDVFLALRKAQKINVDLIIAGIPNWRKSGFFKEVQKSSYGNNILFADYITQDDLVALYQGAKVFLYPSLYEGFGIPPLEAMASGAPVITSNVTSIPEIVGEAALLVNPTSSEDLTEKLLILLNNETLRLSVIEKGFKRAKEFSWVKMARDTLCVYEATYKQARQ